MESRYTGIGDAELITEKNLQVAAEYVDTIHKFFPYFDKGAYLQIFIRRFELLSDFITAMMENDVDEINRLTRDLYRNAEERADFTASFTPFGSEEEYRNMLYRDLRDTIEQSNAFLAGDYQRSVDIFARILDLSENRVTVLGRRLFDYITQNQEAQLT